MHTATMNDITGYYGQPYHSIDPRRSMDQFPQDTGMEDPDHASIDANMMGGQQTLDQIISHNNQEMMRRRTTYQPQYRQPGHTDVHLRRASMMEFGSAPDPDLDEFQFDPNPTHSAIPADMPNIDQTQKSLDSRKVRSRDDLSLDTRFSQKPNFEHLPNATTYSSAMISAVSMGLDPVSVYMPQSMDLSMDFDGVGGKNPPMNLHGPSGQQPMFSESPIAQQFPLSYPSLNEDPGGSSTSPQISAQMMSEMPQPAMKCPPTQQPQLRKSLGMPTSLSNSQALDSNLSTSSANLQQANHQVMSRVEAQSAFLNRDLTSEKHPPDSSLPTINRFANAYSSSGFDMLGVLMRVATRPNPEINIGPVDLSCAFVVCDVTKHDLPIVYCSEMFERLTGYTRFEILGRNCRFLQSPDGRVQSGVKRKYVDDRSVLYLKNQVSKRAEAQLSLINYRKGGQPFMNLLTMIPVQWDTEEYRFFVGFQVDLVEQPNSVAGMNPDGTYAINYQRGQLPSYVLQPPEMSNSLQADIGQTIGREEVSAVLSSIGAGESEHVKRIWDKVLLENTDDVVHVLSLKGLFLYLSPACRKVLEYDASELVGTALSSVCHPSDIVPVTRELKDTSTGAAVNVVYRIRRKHSGYTWFESHGCLHTEQGKGRKCIILVGRERPVYALNRKEMTMDSGISDSELWTKLSTSGMFLFVSSTVRSMLDRVPDDLVGTSMQALMRPEARKEFNHVLELARTGEISTFKHDLQNRRGQVLQAQSTIYPGDAQKGFKPTFVLAQTRLLKMTRAMLLNQKPSGSPRTDLASVGSATPSTQISGPTTTLSLQLSTSIASPGKTNDSGVMTAPGCSGLPLGDQDEALASEENIFDELKTTRSTSWQFELRQMERQNRLLAEELAGLLSRKKKRKRRKGMGQLEKDCANCHTRVTPEWRRGPSGQRDLCNSCGLRWAKQNGRVSPRKYSGNSDKDSTSPQHNANTESKGTSSTSLQASSSTTPLKTKSDSTRPPKIEEDQEPEDENILLT